MNSPKTFKEWKKIKNFPKNVTRKVTDIGYEYTLSELKDEMIRLKFDPEITTIALDRYYDDDDWLEFREYETEKEFDKRILNEYNWYIERWNKRNNIKNE